MLSKNYFHELMLRGWKSWLPLNCIIKSAHITIKRGFQFFPHFDELVEKYHIR